MIGSIFLIMFFCVTGQAIADSMIAPDLPHYIFNERPFAIGAGSGRYQQVYDSSMFPSPIYITSLAFSPDRSGAYTANIDIRLGYTLKEPGSLSTDLDTNVLVPLTSVFSDPSFSQSITGGSETFSLVFDFSSSPFLLTPGARNLLLDIVISDQNLGFACSRFDRTISGFSSRAWEDINGVGYADDAGLRTLIGYTRVPEPGILILLSISMASVVGLRRWWKE